MTHTHTRMRMAKRNIPCYRNEKLTLTNTAININPHPTLSNHLQKWPPRTLKQEMWTSNVVDNSLIYLSIPTRKKFKRILSSLRFLSDYIFAFISRLPSILTGNFSVSFSFTLLTYICFYIHPLLFQSVSFFFCSFIKNKKQKQPRKRCMVTHRSLYEIFKNKKIKISYAFRITKKKIATIPPSVLFQFTRSISKKVDTEVNT